MYHRVPPFAFIRLIESKECPNRVKFVSGSRDSFSRRFLFRPLFHCFFDFFESGYRVAAVSAFLRSKSWKRELNEEIEKRFSRSELAR